MRVKTVLMVFWQKAGIMAGMVNGGVDGTKFSFTESYPDFDLDRITSYAAVKNVRLIGHHETGGAVYKL